MTEKQPRVKIKKILKICKILFILWIIYLIGIPLYYTPYELQPSYWEFKKMCELNELPNNEEKYNKILKYFDTSLDTLDWEELNGKKQKLIEENFDYKKGVFEYITQMKLRQFSSRIDIRTHFFSNESEINRYNANAMVFRVIWHTKRFYPAGNEGSGFYWSEETLGCSNDDNMTPKGENNE